MEIKLDMVRSKEAIEKFTEARKNRQPNQLFELYLNLKKGYEGANCVELLRKLKFPFTLYLRDDYTIAAGTHETLDAIEEYQGDDIVIDVSLVRVC